MEFDHPVAVLFLSKSLLGRRRVSSQNCGFSEKKGFASTLAPVDASSRGGYFRRALRQACTGPAYFLGLLARRTTIYLTQKIDI